uniref:Uncharacterized protein n=1 Tax=Arundo donax TaxID=35708 RepID=A0A0A9FF72_ARUDO
MVCLSAPHASRAFIADTIHMLHLIHGKPFITIILAHNVQETKTILDPDVFF